MTDGSERPTHPKSRPRDDAPCATNMQSCSGQEPENWIELEYLYCDSTGVAGAHYRVVNNDTGGVVAQGTLDDNGYAFCPLPLSVKNVSYDFDKDPPTVAYLKKPVPNPELPKVKAGWFDRLADGIADRGSWVWGAIQGDFNEDQTVGQVATNAVITMIPVVDQVGDVRDIVANLKFLIWDKRYNDKWVWIALVLTLIGLIPVLGSAAKGVLKTVANALKTAGKAPLNLLIEVLNWAHKGNAVKWLRKLAADLPGHAATMKGKFRDILKNLREKMKSVAAMLPGSLGKKADDAVNSIDEVARIADGKIDEAVRELQDGLNKSLDEAVDFEKKGATKSKNARKQTDADPPKISPETLIATKVSPDMEKKILYGKRVSNPDSPGGMSNELIGGHSPSIKSDPNYNVEVLSKNPDGTTKVKLITQYPDGKLSNIKTSTLAPDNWNDKKIIEATEQVGDSPAVSVRAKDGATLHRQTIDGVQWDVIKNASGELTSSYPTGGKPPPF